MYIQGIRSLFSGQGRPRTMPVSGSHNRPVPGSTFPVRQIQPFFEGSLPRLPMHGPSPAIHFPIEWTYLLAAEIMLFVAEKQVEGSKRTVASADVLLKVYLIGIGEFFIGIDVLFQYPQP